MHAAAEQQALLPELVLPPPPPDQAPRFAVWGLLEEDAHVFTAAGGRVHLQVLVAQHLQLHPDACHVLATYVYPDLGTPQATEIAAHSRARAMRTRTEVVVSGEALVPGLHRGRRVSVLLHVRGISLADEIVSPHHHSGA